jgi:DNA (cytosine-5)-methyltransferase 1
MKSANPHSGCRATETARTLDTSNPCPSKNQGGLAVVHVHPKVCGTLCASASGLNRPGGMASETDLCVVYCLQGNMIGRQDHNGPKGSGINEETAFTLTATDVCGVAACYNRQRSDLFKEDNIAGTQTARQYKDSTDLICEKKLNKENINQAAVSVDCRNYCENEELSGTLQAKTTPGYSLNYQNPVRSGYIVRRLLPVECERLQGYPDGWTQFGHDGKEISDTRRYQMLGNSIAVPCVAYIMIGIMEQFRKEESCN